MIRRTSAITLLLFISVLLVACSGPPGGGCVSNCGGNNAHVSFVLRANPPDPNSGLAIQTFAATITGITLTPASGSVFNVPLNSSAYIAEFNRVTSDSTLLAAGVSLPAANYTQITVTFSAPRITFCTQATPGVPGCAPGTLASISGSAGSATVSTSLNPAANQNSGVALQADIATALTLSGQTVTAINLAAANVFTASVLPAPAAQSDLPSTELSHVDDVMGLVTGVSGSTLTIQTSARGNITATANSSTQFSADCTTLGFAQNFTCVKANTIAIADTLLNSDGTFTLVFYQPFPAGLSTGDLLEGVVASVPNSVTGQFTVVVTDSVFASSGSLLSGQLHLGDQIVVTLGSPNPFQIVSKGLQIPTGSTLQNSTSVSDILPGQTVAIAVSAFTAPSGSTPGAAAAQNLALRFTRFTAVMGTPTLPVFTATTFPPFFGITGSQQFQTSTGRLSVDGASTLTGIPAGSAFSTTALYIGPPVAPQFAAQSVRAH